MEWDWGFVAKIMPALLQGVVVTVQATLLGSAVAMVVGLAIAILRRSPVSAIRRATHFLAELVRRTPLLLQLYFLFYILPDIGILLPPLFAGVIGIGTHYATYTAQVYRAGIESVPRSQWEAAKAANLTPGQTWRHVVLPQALPPMIPPLGNYFIAMFKETPILSAITVLELMTQARTVANFSYRYVEPMTLVAVFFLCVSIPGMLLIRYLERRFGPL